MSNPTVKQVELVVEGRMSYEEEWTELEPAQNKEHARSLINTRMSILRRSDNKYQAETDKTNPEQVNVFYNKRLQRIYRFREVR